MPETHLTADVLILHGLVLTMDPDSRILQDGALAISGSSIVAVGESLGLARQYDATEIVDATDQIVMPGLINAHTHAPAVLFRGLIEDLALEPWLNRAWRLEKKMLNPDSIRLGAQLAYAEMIQGGTTAALDMYWYAWVSVEVARQIGFRLITGPAYLETPDPPDLIPDEQRTARGREFLQQLRNDPLIVPCVNIHGTYTVTPRYLREARALADEFSVLLNTHASESKTEVETVERQYGLKPPHHLDAHGILSGPTVLAHCVQLEQDEIELLARRATAVAHCPISNLKVGAGIAPIGEMCSRGVRVMIGTDGAQSSNDLDLWKAMRMAALLQKGIHHDPAVVPAKQVVKMVTSDAAAALGLGDRIGALEAGKCADVILVDLNRSHSLPFYDPYSHLVYSAGREDVSTVVINGKIVMRERRMDTIDETELKDRARSLSRHVRAVMLEE